MKGIKMTWLAFFLIVGSAGFHATWNLLAKKSVMTVSFYGAICMTSCLLWIHTQFWTPVHYFQLPFMFWVYIIASVLSDLVYCLGLVRAYRTMEMSTAYPMMRSLPLLFTALLTTCLGWGKVLTPLAITGMVIVFIGCLMMPLKNFSDFNWRYYLSPKMLFIIFVACGTTGYTIFDSQAQTVLRSVCTDIDKPVLSISYYSIRGICLSSCMLLTIFIMPNEKKNFISFFKERNLTPVYAGLIASLCYVTVLISMNYVTNVSYVQVFRQLGLVFALLGGIFILKEQCNLPKFIGVALIIGGLIITVI